jgi:predicted  nucleic acid-binding Zn-ribbon protein
MEATVEEIRALLELAQLDAQANTLAPEAYRTRHDAIGKRMAAALLERYQRLRAVGRHPVVVAAERGTCSGCHVRLPTMLAYQLGRSAAVHPCPHCRRMLYAPELLAEVVRVTHP